MVSHYIEQKNITIWSHLAHCFLLIPSKKHFYHSADDYTCAPYQCDQIGRFSIVFGDILYYKVAQIFSDVLGYFVRHQFLSITCCGHFSTTFVTIWVTFYYIWSHCSQFKRSVVFNSRYVVCLTSYIYFVVLYSVLLFKPPLPPLVAFTGDTHSSQRHAGLQHSFYE